MNHDYQILEITNGDLKKKYTEEILRLLPDWFGVEASLMDYVNTVSNYPFFCAMKGDICIGFFSICIHHERTGEIYVCAIHPEYHGMGVGTALFEHAEAFLKAEKCDYFMVKTLSPLRNSESYNLTRKFYAAVGFVDFYTDINIWDHENPCLMMIKNLV